MLLKSLSKLNILLILVNSTNNNQQLEELEPLINISNNMNPHIIQEQKIHYLINENQKHCPEIHHNTKKIIEFEKTIQELQAELKNIEHQVNKLEMLYEIIENQNNNKFKCNLI